MFAAGICGWTLARAPAGSGDAVERAGYLGKSDRSITDFSERHADHKERDNLTLAEASWSGRLQAIESV